MYQYDSGQISVDDFEQLIGINIKTDNRWVQKARKTPWEAIKKHYCPTVPIQQRKRRQAAAVSTGCMHYSVGVWVS